MKNSTLVKELYEFKKKHGVVFRRLFGEIATVNDVIRRQSWRKRLPELLQEYNSCDIFNFDRSGLFCECLPHLMLSFKNAKWHGERRKAVSYTHLTLPTIYSV